MIRIVLVDDHPAVRHALRVRLALEADFQIVGEAPDGAQALDVIAALRPDVALMDVAMPRLDGITATQRLRDIAPECAIVMMSVHDDPATRQLAAAAGAAAFLGKHEAVGEMLANTLRAVIDHGMS